MHFIIILGTILFSLTSTVHATTDQLITSTNALVKQADTIDAAVLALTPQTPATTAQEIPPSLQSLTAAVAAAITISTPTDPTSDPATDFTVLDTYGLFANTAWELMDEYAYQKPNLDGVFGLKAVMYSQLTSFNSAFQDLSTFTTAILNDAEDKIDMGYYIGNTTLNINLALAAFAP